SRSGFLGVNRLKCSSCVRPECGISIPKDASEEIHALRQGRYFKSHHHVARNIVRFMTAECIDQFMVMVFCVLGEFINDKFSPGTNRLAIHDQSNTFSNTRKRAVCSPPASDFRIDMIVISSSHGKLPICEAAGVTEHGQRGFYS